MGGRDLIITSYLLYQGRTSAIISHQFIAGNHNPGDHLMKAEVTLATMLEGFFWYFDACSKVPVAITVRLWEMTPWGRKRLSNNMTT